MRCLIFDLAACTRPKVQMMQRSRLLSCSNVHDVEPCAFFLACRAVSWRALGILGRRACILSSPSHFLSLCEHAKHQESFVSIHTVTLKKNSSI